MSILVSAAVRLAAFNLESIQRITDRDTLDLGSLGEKKRAIFAIIPDNDTSLNYLVGMLYSAAFQSLYYIADYKYSGSLPVHVRFIQDEWANVAQPDSYVEVLSTARSRNCSFCINVQAIAQIKALYKDNWEVIVGNCDTLLYLGGNEQSTHEYISKLLGSETLTTKSTGLTRGRSGSSSENKQSSKRELMTPDEVRMLDNQYALLFIRGELPVMDFKYEIMQHPNIKLTEDGGAAPYIRASASYETQDISSPFSGLENYEFYN